MALTESAYRTWLLGTLDIMAAFLETPISRASSSNSITAEHTSQPQPVSRAVGMEVGKSPIRAR